jgi:transcriptional regulator with XRE-family HTH domain
MTNHIDESGLMLNGQRLRQARHDLNLSQAAFAQALQAAVSENGHQLRPTKRLVQKWEAGEHRHPHRHYQTAIAAVTGIPYRNLCRGSYPLDTDNTAQKLERLQNDLHHLARQVEHILRDVRLSML